MASSCQESCALGLVQAKWTRAISIISDGFRMLQLRKRAEAFTVPIICNSKPSPPSPGALSLIISPHAPPESLQDAYALETLYRYGNEATFRAAVGAVTIRTPAVRPIQEAGRSSHAARSLAYTPFNNRELSWAVSKFKPAH